MTRSLFARVALMLVLAACSNAVSVGAGGAAVAQGPPETAFSPAFEGQTRAPERRSGVNLNIVEVASGLETPWAIAFLPDGRALVTEKVGRVRVISEGGALSAPVVGIPQVDARGQGGLMDIALSPTFARDRTVFFSFTEPRGEEGSGTSVARGRLSEDSARLTDVQVIFRQTPSWRNGLHFGSRLVFDREGRLYVTLGERSVPMARVLAQDLSALLGKVVRINADGTIPQDNPFVGRSDARSEIWTYGHRNVQGADLHPETGVLWTIEHGPQGGDEINVPRAGHNYGWPVISYGEDYSGAPIGNGIAVMEGMEQPIYYWDPVIAPSDMDFYEGSMFPWRGDILIAALRAQALVRIVVDGERVVGEERFALGVGRIRDIEEAQDGAIWVAADDGRILRLTPR